MSVEVDYFYADNIFQADEFAEWFWSMGQPVDGRFWSFAIVPEYANTAVCEVTRHWFSTDNDQNLTAHFDIRVDYDSHPGGVLLGFKAIRAPSV